jgi:CBS domain containing-hemolysin-like protein
MIPGPVIYLSLVACLALSFLLSGMEAGVFALNRLRVRRLARIGNDHARVLQKLLNRPERFLWTILVGNTLVNFLLLGWVFARLHGAFAGHVFIILPLLTLAVFCFYVFFDLLPKMLFRTYPNRLCLAFAPLFRWVGYVLAPPVWLVEEISRLALRWTGRRVFTGRLFGNREEMRAVMAEAAQALTGEEHAMINRVLDLQHFTVARIMTPLEKVVAVDTTTPLAQALALAATRRLSRLPVWQTRDGQRRVAGLLDVNQLLFRGVEPEGRTAGEFMSPALFIDEDTRLEIALRRMQRAGERLAIVLARDRCETGVATLEDILKLMFGEVKL